MSVVIDSDETPKTISENGAVPESRMGDARSVQSRINLLIQADGQERSPKRARLKGLVDGNPPYKNSDLVAAGTAQRCNVNWRTAESYVAGARGAFYDTSSEVPTYATVRTKEGGVHDRDKNSKIITEEFDKLLKSDRCFDYHTQISQHEMVLYGCGPLTFEDTTDWRTVSIPHRNLLVPEMATSDANQWDECTILVDYDVAKLYKFIRSEKAAVSLGWRVRAVKDAIKKAHVRSDGDGKNRGWEWYQQQLKNNCTLHTAQSKVVKCAHYFVREFPEGDGDDDGKITHAIVLIGSGEEAQKENDFLFKKVGRFDGWQQIIHPQYLDNDGGGYHHSVTGLGIKMFSAMQAQNRLLCNAFDKAFSPKQLFKPTSAQAAETMSITHLGDYGKLPMGWDAIQMPVGSFMDEVLILNRELSGMIAANLSSFRQNLSKDTGNPITAKEAGLRASEQARLSHTQLNHYFAQRDWLYEEQYRRASSAKVNSNLPGGKAAKEFQKRCTDRGVPIEAVRNFESVKATRVIGQGSPFLRQEVTQEFLATSQLNPSSAGRRNILEDYYAARAGVALAARYMPEIVDHEATDHKAIATLQVAAARNGVPPVFSANQDHRIFSECFFEAIGTAFQSLQQGADPQQVYSFVDALGPVLKQHIGALAEDPRNKQLAAEFEKQWAKVASMMDKLGKQIEQMKQQQAEQQAKQQQAQRVAMGQDPELALEAATQRAKLAMQKQKADQSMQIKGRKAAQDLSITDAKAASAIINEARRTEAATATTEE